MKFKLNKYNLDSLLSVAELAKNNKVERLEIELDTNLENLSSLSEIISFIYPILDYEIYYQVWLKNFPFCVIDLGSVDHILFKDKNFKGEKVKQCQKCYWNKKCPGFPKGYFKKYGFKEVCPKPDLPEEVMIEVTSRCNFNCQFCFNKISFAHDGRVTKDINTDYLKKIIDGLIRAKIKIIRFTGGEPLLRKDIFELMEYTKNKGVEVRLNTNGSLINNDVAKKLRDIVDNVLIPIESWTNLKESKISGFKNALKKKIKAIKLLKNQNIPIVRAGTVMTKYNILNFDKISQLISELPLDEWEVYRPVSISKKKDLNLKYINILVDKLIDLRRKIDKPVSIANAIPFCSIKDLNKINSVSNGALYDDGHNRLVIDPRNFVKPHYFMDENIGNSLNILGAWQSLFMKKMRNLEYLPNECQGCPFIFKCRGGSRHAAKIINGGYNKLDPLAKYYGKSRY